MTLRVPLEKKAVRSQTRWRAFVRALPDRLASHQLVHREVVHGLLLPVIAKVPESTKRGLLMNEALRTRTADKSGSEEIQLSRREAIP
jgi:hypothetical protein